MFWDIYREMEDLKKSLERAFGDYPIWRRPFSRIAFLPGLGSRQYPLINIYDDKDNVYVEALAPGLDTEKLDVSVLQNAITVTGEKLPVAKDVTPESFHRSERATGKFTRKIEVTSPIQENKIKAEYNDGLLRITLPKAEEAKPRRVAIGAGK